VTEFQSRRELREAERQGLIPKPEQVFDLPTGSIRLPEASEMLTRKRIREMEREGVLDPLTGAMPVAPASEEQTAGELTAGDQILEQRSYDEVLAETEEPITATISAVIQPTSAQVAAPVQAANAPIAATDIFHNMAVDPNARKPKTGLFIALILVLLGAAGTAAYMLGIFK
jgi:hypothetical protein